MENYTTIDTFLANWKENTKRYYYNVLAERVRLDSEYREICEELGFSIYEINSIKTSKKTYRVNKKNVDAEDIPEKMINAYEAIRDFKKSNSASTEKVVDILAYKSIRGGADEYLNEVLDKEVENKKASLIKRIEKKAGKIVDAGMLYIASDGNINGNVEGEKAKVRVETILAGGYNIQKLHYRVLVK